MILQQSVKDILARLFLARLSICLAVVESARLVVQQWLFHGESSIVRRASRLSQFRLTINRLMASIGISGTAMFVGCSAVPIGADLGPTTAEAVAAGTMKTQDSFTKIDLIMSPPVGRADTAGGSLSLLYGLSHDALIYAGPFLRVTVYRSYSGPGLAAIHPTSARDIDATVLKIFKTRIEHSTYGAHETTDILLPPDYLERTRTSGTVIRLYGMSGTHEFEVPAYLIEGFIHGSEPLLREHGLEGIAPATPP